MTEIGMVLILMACQSTWDYFMPRLAIGIS